MGTGPWSAASTGAGRVPARRRKPRPDAGDSPEPEHHAGELRPAVPAQGVLPAAVEQLTVLLIEDDAGDALLVEEAVADGGIPLKLHWSRTLAEALDALRQHRPDCVLLDLHLSDAQGQEALERVLGEAGSSAVVVLTGLAEERAALAAVAAGAQDYLIKGRLEPDLFVRAIRYAIQRKETEQDAVALQASRIHARENRRLERGLLPTPLVRDDTLEITSRYQPGREQTLLGGDFYDVVELRDGTTHAVVGDVSGHGPDAAALGVCLRVAWRAFVLAGVSGHALLELLERILVAERAGPEIFATLTTLSRAPGAPAVDLVRAGHPGVLLRAPDGAVRLEEVVGGPVLGLVPEMARWPVVPVALPPGTGVLMFTDGLIEGRVGQGSERLGEQGLVRLAGERPGASPEDLVDGLIGAAQELATGHGGLEDDVAVLHLRWRADG